MVLPCTARPVQAFTEPDFPERGTHPLFALRRATSRGPRAGESLSFGSLLCVASSAPRISDFWKASETLDAWICHVCKEKKNESEISSFHYLHSLETIQCDLLLTLPSHFRHSRSWNTALGGLTNGCGHSSALAFRRWGLALSPAAIGPSGLYQYVLLNRNQPDRYLEKTLFNFIDIW